MKFIGVFSFFILFNFHSSFSQTPKIDSLKEALNRKGISEARQVVLNNQIGYEYWIIDPNESISYGNEALSIATTTNDIAGQAYANRIIGVGYWATGNYEPALQHLYSSKENYQQTNDSLGIANCILNIGMVYSDQNDQQSALDHFNTAIEIFERLEKTGRVATTYTKIADIYIEQKDFEQALTILKKAYNMHKDNDFTYGKAESLNRLGLLYKAIGSEKDAILHLKISAEMSESINDKDGLAKSFENLASVYIQTNDLENALRYAKKAEEQAKEIGSLKWLSDIYLDFKLIYQAQKDHKKALEYYDLHIQYKDSIFNEEVAKDISNLHSRMEAEKHKAQLILDQQKLELLTQKSRLNKLLAISGISLLVFIGIISFLIVRTQKLKIIKEKQATEEENEKLQREIEAKSQELTAYTINFIRKNELLEELKSEIEMIKSNGNSEVKSKLGKLGKIVNTHQQVDRDWEDFKMHFESVHKDFFVKLKNQNEALTSNDLKLCALIRLNLTMKEMGQMLGISAESVKTARYRLRKKLELNHEESLNNYLIGIDESRVAH